ncbi:MAG: iron chaperone [Actinomycetes bacterium]
MADLPDDSDLPFAVGAAARRALAEARVLRLDDLARCAEADVAALHGVGPRAVRLLRQALAVDGRTFRIAPTPVDEYLAGVDEPERSALERVRRIVHSVVPGGEEVISYQLPTITHHGMVAAFARNKNFCSLYVAYTLAQFRDRLDGFSMTKSAVHFTPEQLLPEQVVVDICRARVVENEARAAARRRR